MNDKRQIKRSSKSPGDSVVDGLFSGVQAGVLAGGLLFGMSWIPGLGLSRVFSSVVSQSGGSLLPVIILFLAVPAFYGSGFGLLCHLVKPRRLAPPTWLAGVVGALYGGLLFTITQTVLAQGEEEILRAFPQYALIGSHILYGMVLGIRTHLSSLEELQPGSGGQESDISKRDIPDGGND